MFEMGLKEGFITLFSALENMYKDAEIEVVYGVNLRNFIETFWLTAADNIHHHNQCVNDGPNDHFQSYNKISSNCTLIQSYSEIRKLKEMGEKKKQQQCLTESVS